MATQSLSQIPVAFNGMTFLLDVAEGNLMSLNAIYAAAGSPANKEPWRWLDTEGAIHFIDSICEILNLAKTQVLKTKRGRHGGGTWAHWKVATKYAAYLEPALENIILDVFRERVQEEANPELSIKRGRDRAIAAWRRQGKTEDWIEQRCKQIDSWHGFTDTLKEHGVTGDGYGRCADSLNVPILGGTSKQIRKARSIVGKSLRDGLDEVENAAINFAQVLAKKKIKEDNVHGNYRCSIACYKSAEKVAQVL
jgi:hypothetical protein